MFTHTYLIAIQSIAIHSLPPEYLHTVVAMTSYLDHLRVDRFLIFEVCDVDELARVSGLRILNALFTAQEQAGDTNPQDNFYI